MRRLCLVKVTPWHSFQQSAILSVTLIRLPQTWRHTAILRGKDNKGLLYYGIDEIQVRNLTQVKQCWKINLLRQSHLINL
jgi:hypothetical protein